MSMWVDANLAIPQDGQEILAIIDGAVRIAKYEYGYFHYDLEWVDGAEYNARIVSSDNPRVTKWRPLPTVNMEK